ncbi:peptidoglycan bridge formation glycyltransferase FemA/FemB family protein [soil metagenome]
MTSPENSATDPYRVREVRDLPAEQWDTLVKNSPGGGHIFQSHAWAEFKRELSWSAVRVAIEKDDDVVGVGQFLSYSTTPVPGRLMFCPKGPWLPWEDEETVKAFFEGVREIAKNHGAHTIKIEPEVRDEQKAVKDWLSDIGFQKFRWDLNFKTTLVVDLSPPEEEIMANMRKSNRSSVRSAARKGVEVVEDSTSHGLQTFWEMFELTAQRSGFWYRPKDYQVPMWRSLMEAGRAHLLFAEHEGDQLAGMFIGKLGYKCWYQYGASTNEKRELNGTHLLQWEMMKWAKSHGVTYYDMVSIPNPDELNEDHPLYGVYKFKAGFGGEIASFVGCLDLPVMPARAKLWNRFEPMYYRLYRKLKGDIYY